MAHFQRAYRFENSELVDMLILYGECHQNAAAASRMYAERFLRRHPPGPRQFTNLVQRARETGNLQEHRGGHAGRPRLQQMLDLEEEILEIIGEDPAISTRQIAHRVNTCHSKVWSTLRENQLHPYHVQRVQSLIPPDYPRRVRFSEWLLEQTMNHENFINQILITDETTFTRNGTMNFRNTHVWAFENPHAIRRTNFQHKFSINIWAGIVNGILIGPFILPDRMDGMQYLNFLQNDLPELLEEVPLNIRQNMWFLHDGAPPHYRLEVRNYLNYAFPHRWIGRNGPIAWPPRSPDLNACDFYLWGHMKQLVYTSEIHTVEELRDRIFNAANQIRQQQGLLSCGNSWIRRSKLCIANNSNNFEHLL